MSVFNENAIIGTSGAGASAYSIDNSCRFDAASTPTMTRTPSIDGNRRTFTLSVWVKLGAGTQASGYYGQFFAARSGASGNYGLMQMLDVSGLRFHFGDSTGASCKTLNKYRDCSAWYHVVYKIDSTQSTSSDRVKIYVNNELATLDSPTYPSLNVDFKFNGGVPHHVGEQNSSDRYDGYMAEMHWIDGTALDPTSFGESGDYGEWKPIEVTGLTYGTNGFYLDFADAADLGDDESGNTNDFAETNLTASDQMTDTPTNNFCTWDGLNSPVGTLSEGNLKIVGTTYNKQAIGTFPMSSGKWYWEVQVVTNGTRNFLGVAKFEATGSGTSLSASDDWAGVYGHDGATYQSGGTENAEFGTSFSSGDIITICFDADIGSFWLNKNAAPNTGATALVTSLPSGLYNLIYEEASGGAKATNILNAGQDGTFAGTKTAQGNADGNGYGNFYYAPPSGFLALCTKNLPSPTVTPSKHFNAVLYTGNSTTNAITDVGFQPDMVWLKGRSQGSYHGLYDVVRGAGSTKGLYSNTNDAEGGGTNPTHQNFVSFDSGGFTLGATSSSNIINDNTQTYVGWNWKANGSGASNTDGTINTTSTSANVAAGFSISTYTGTGSNATVGHGLAVAPTLVIVKRRSATNAWQVGVLLPSLSIDFTDELVLNTSAAADTSTGNWWNNTNPTASVFSIGSNAEVNASTATFVAYCWHSVEGYSKIGSYKGGGSATAGTFIYTGFKPAFVMIKSTSRSAANWNMYDNARSPYNQANERLLANDSATESTSLGIDIVSNGFTPKTVDGQMNTGDGYYMYMAFAETPFKYANAR